jgi:hypothetical protein
MESPNAIDGEVDNWEMGVTLSSVYFFSLEAWINCSTQNLILNIWDQWLPFRRNNQL